MKVASALTLVAAALACSGAFGDELAAGGEPFVGFYRGVARITGQPDAAATGTVVAEGPGLYRATATYSSQGADAQVYQVALHGHVEGPRVLFNGFSGGTYWNGQAREGKLAIKRSEEHYGGSFELERVVQHSPTEGQAPPANAKVLLPYKANQKPDMSAWTNQKWKALPDGSMRVEPGTGPSLTKESFGDFRLHLELNVPHMPFDVGQARANSGVYLQNRFELQILDSFGVIPGAGDCGAVYGQSTPRVNACYPPGEWQTYDVAFRAPRYTSDGTLERPGSMTVSHNGIEIQTNVPLHQPTLGGVEGPYDGTGLIQLQDHGNAPHFRNIWAVSLDEEE
jgi:hypothetical protein